MENEALETSSTKRAKSKRPKLWGKGGVLWKLWWTLCLRHPDLVGGRDQWNNRVKRDYFRHFHDLYIDHNGFCHLEKVQESPAQGPSDQDPEQVNSTPPIPPIPSGVQVRFCFEDGYSPIKGYIRSFQKLSEDAIPIDALCGLWDSEEITGRGFNALYLQWGSSTPPTWWESASFFLDGRRREYQMYHGIFGSINFTADLVALVKKAVILENSEGSLICKSTPTVYCIGTD
ncbi:hypothetical protein PG994_009733 [Apiospora phragmitis]|uniref:Uncharacterized protein n=1 Tax=Apiospora phragmitis TaxID=2905665 RepID=A0ABR1U925_9PEZI